MNYPLSFCRPLTPQNHPKIRSITPTLYRVPQTYLQSTPNPLQNSPFSQANALQYSPISQKKPMEYVQNRMPYSPLTQNTPVQCPPLRKQFFFSALENKKNSFLLEKSSILTEPIEKNCVYNTNKTPNYKKEFEKDQISTELEALKKENEGLKEQLELSQSKGLLERQMYEEKMLKINSELNKRLINERNHQKPDKSNKLYDKLIEEMKLEHIFLIETLKKDHKKSIEMYETLINELEGNINELLKKNSMLNLNLKESERKNREIEQKNKQFNKKAIKLEAEKLK